MKTQILCSKAGGYSVTFDADGEVSAVQIKMDSAESAARLAVLLESAGSWASAWNKAEMAEYFANHPEAGTPLA